MSHLILLIFSHTMLYNMILVLAQKIIILRNFLDRLWYISSRNILNYPNFLQIDKLKLKIYYFKVIKFNKIES